MNRRYLVLPIIAIIALLATLPLLRTRELPPAPTEHRLDQLAEQRNGPDRRAWMEELHRTAPGTDWRAIERANGAERQALRNEAARRDEHDQRWTEIGSRNLAGRMHVAAHNSAGDSLYGGSSRGGVWKGSLTGDGWRPLGDNLWGGSHGLAIAGSQGEVITSVTDDGRLHYTDDGGQTWLEPTGISGAISSCKRVATDASDPDRVLLMVRTSYGTRLYASRDAGRTYLQVRALTTSNGDFWLDRVAGGAVYLLDGNRLYRSDSSLLSWTDLGTLPVASPNNVVLTGSEAGAPTLYAALRIGSQWRLYRSTDAGGNWSFRYNIGDFWESLCASIVDPDLVVFGGVEIWRSVNGGMQFAKINNWWDYYDDPVNKLHADCPGLDCVATPGGGEVWYVSTDGGLYHSHDGLASVTNISLEGLGVSQYYDILTSVNDPDLVLAGAQDQGYQRSTGPSRDSAGWDFEQLISGDYGHLTSSDGSHGLVFSVYPGFVLVQQGELNPVLAGYPDFPADNHSWLPFIVADPDDPYAFYFCGSHLHRGTWRGGDDVQYTASSQDFTTAGGSYLTAFGIAPSNHQDRLAIVDNGRIWYTSDGGAQWRLSADTGPSAHYFYGTALVHSSTDSRRAWIGGSGYSGPGVWRTTDGGATWEGAGTGLPSTLVYGLALESPGSELLYAATEAGPYRLDPDTDTWEYIGGSRAPLTTYWCVEAVPEAQVVRFGTYGRGIWDYATDTATSAPEEMPVAVGLAVDCAPNPFNPRTTIGFGLASGGPVTVDIHDAAGRRIATLHRGDLGAGRHELVWDGRDAHGGACASGVYLVRVTAAGGAGSTSITLVR